MNENKATEAQTGMLVYRVNVIDPDGHWCDLGVYSTHEKARAAFTKYIASTAELIGRNEDEFKSLTRQVVIDDDL